MALCESGDSLINSVHPKVSMQVTISDVPWRIGDIPQHVVLESLDSKDVTFAGTTPELYAIGPHWFEDLFIQKYFVLGR